MKRFVVTLYRNVQGVVTVHRPLIFVYCLCFCHPKQPDVAFMFRKYISFAFVQYLGNWKLLVC